MRARAGRARVAIVAAVLVAGCDGCGSASRLPEGEQPGGATRSSVEGEGDPSGTGTAPSGNVSGVILRGLPGRERSVAIVVEVRGTEAVRLAKTVIVEQEQNGAFSRVESIQSVFLRRDCQTEPEDCVELVPGAALEPPPWRGELGDAQCACERCVDAPSGRYRFVVTGCDGTARVESAAFELPDA